jgi:hypothetical protein
MRVAREFVAPYYQNVSGWRTRRKLVVIESDDWGSIRMPSRTVYERCLKKGYPVDQTFYERYDALLSEDDVELLFDLLASFRDKRHQHPRITANVIVGNPNFDAIEADGYNAYHWEPITDTFARYPRHNRCLALWHEGMRKGLLCPQFHGREHLNVGMFIGDLQKQDQVAVFALNNRMPGCIPMGPKALPNLYVETTRFRSIAEKQAVLDAQLLGLKLFKRLFGFRSRSLIPTNYVWSSDFNAEVARAGVEALQGTSVMKEQRTNGTSIPIRRRLGETNAQGQIQLVRNAFFEPSLRQGPAMQEVGDCLYRIRAAFQLRRPAIISCHRINFCGFIDAANRDENLRALRALLTSILVRWPDVEFLTSVELLDVIRQDTAKVGKDACTI